VLVAFEKAAEFVHKSVMRLPFMIVLASFLMPTLIWIMAIMIFAKCDHFIPGFSRNMGVVLRMGQHRVGVPAMSHFQMDLKWRFVVNPMVSFPQKNAHSDAARQQQNAK